MLARSGEDIAAELIMMQTSSRGPFVIVEGPTDECFLWPRLKRTCYISIGSGRISVEKAVEILDRSSSNISYVGIVDEDYDWLIGYAPASRNVLKTDPRDIEGMLFRSSALSAVLAEFGNRGAIQQLERLEGSVINAILARAEPFGKIRMVNSAGPMVDMTSFKPMRFCRADWTYNLDEAMRCAVRCGVAPDIGTLESRMAVLSPPDIWHCVRGHDLVDILVGGLIHKFGAGNVDRRGVERLLRQSLPPVEFARTKLYERLIAWEGNNCTILN